jgi:hypothetical protein
MPNGPSIFETTGAWEDYSDAGARFSPADRDRRGAGISRSRRASAERYAIPAGKSVADVKAELQGVLASELAARKSPIPAATARSGRCRSRT